MIIIQDVFVVTHRVENKNYTNRDEKQQEHVPMTPDEAIAYEYDADIGDALDAAIVVHDNDANQIHWSRKVTHVDG